MLIIEGPDGAGKTTLIKQLRKRYDFITVALGGPVSNPHRMGEALSMFYFFEAASHLTGMPLVADRFPLISEPIYSRLLGRPNAIEEIGLDDPGLMSEHVVVYCRPPIDKIIANLTKNEQLEGVPERINQLVAYYDQFMSNFSVLEYDYTVDSTTKIAEYFDHEFSHSKVTKPGKRATDSAEPVSQH